MKILFLSLPYPDHITDQLYTGLCKVLGVDCVVDFPWKPACHDPAHRVWFVSQVNTRRHSEPEVIDLLTKKAFDFICVPSRAPAIQALTSLSDKVPLAPLVLIDCEEDTRIRHDLWTRYPFRAYFKRDYVWGLRNGVHDLLSMAKDFHGKRELFTRTFPLPLCVDLETIPPDLHSSREIDVSYIGRISHPHRVTAVKILRSQTDLMFNGGVYRDATDRVYKLKDAPSERLKDKLFPHWARSAPYESQKLEPLMDSTGHSPYFDQIFRSKIAVSIRGGGLTPPIRYYEIIACKTLLLSDIPYTVIPNNFEHQRHAVFFRRDFGNLAELARYYATHDSERESIIESGYQHLLKFHTCERRAEYFLDICRKMF